MQIRKLLLSQSAEKYLGFAEKVMYQLEEKRVRLNMPLLKKVMKIDTVTILWHCGEQIKKIILWGEEVAPPFDAEILLTGSNGELFGYLFTSDQLFAGPVIGETAESVHQTFNRTSHFNEKYDVIYHPKDGDTAAFLSNSLIPEEVRDQTHIVNQSTNELAITVDPNEDIWARNDNGFGKLAGREASGVAWENDYCSQMGDLIWMPARRSDMWNSINGLEVFAFNPATSAIFSSWWWFPNISYAARDSELKFNPGWYYGNVFGGIWLDNGEPPPSGTGQGSPSSVVQVTFNSLLDCKYQGRKPYGYAETLVRMDDADYSRVFFYLSEIPPLNEYNQTVLNQGLTFAREVGTVMNGKDWTFYIEPNFKANFPETSTFSSPIRSFDYDVHFWTSPDNRSTDVVYENDYVGVVISLDNNAELHLFSGAQQLLYSTARYHSHAVSSDGRMVAIFETDGSIIDRVIIYDFLSQDISTPIRDSFVVGAAQGISGCFIPGKSSTAFNPSEGSYVVLEKNYEEDKVVPAKAIVQYTFLVADEGLNCKKILNLDGIHAMVGEQEELCFRDNHGFTWIYPNVPVDQFPQGQFTVSVDGVDYSGTWEEVCSKLPYALYTAPAWPFEAGIAKWEGTQIIAPDATASGTNMGITVEKWKEEQFGRVGPIVTETFDPPLNCSTTESLEYVSSRSTDACGLISEETDTVSPLTPVTLTGPPAGTAYKNDQFYGAGGTGVGTYSIESGGGGIAIDPVTGIITEDGCGTIVVKYTDANCPSLTASIPARGKNGSWVRQSPTTGICYASNSQFWTTWATTDCTYLYSCGGPPAVNCAVNSETISGIHKYIDHWILLYQRADAACSPTCVCPAFSSAPYGQPDACCSFIAGFSKYCVQYTEYYLWQC